MSKSSTRSWKKKGWSFGKSIPRRLLSRAHIISYHFLTNCAAGERLARGFEELAEAALEEEEEDGEDTERDGQPRKK